MREKKRNETEERSSPRGLDPIGPSADPDVVTVSSGVHAERLPVGGMTVAQVRSRYNDRFDIDAESFAVLDGAVVDDDTVLGADQILIFQRHAGEKGQSWDQTAQHILAAQQMLGLELEIVTRRPRRRPRIKKKKPETIPTVTLHDRSASVTSPEGQKMALGLDELLDRLGERRMNTGEVLLPDGVKWVTSQGKLTIWCHQTPPRVHHLKWIAENSRARHGPGTRYRKASLALPYVIVFAVFVPHPDGGVLVGDANECFFRTEPLRSLDDELLYPALLNCSKFEPQEQRPLSWICSQFLDRTKSAEIDDENARMRQGFQELMQCLLHSGFNYSSEEHEGQSWFSASREIDRRISKVADWERASREEPLFVLDVPWLPVGKSVRQVAERIAVNNGAARRRTRTSRDAARVLYNHGSAAESAPVLKDTDVPNGTEPSMRNANDKLLTPIFVKTDDELSWPENEAAFYVLSRSGLFLCRNHPFFRSCTPARLCPSELAAHSPFLTLNCPRVPQQQIERIIGFFSEIAELHGSEAAVVLVWDPDAEQLRFEVPVQEAGVSEGWTGSRYAYDVRYDIPQLPPGHSIVGTIHSHVDGPAYASSVDRRDEAHMAGLHIVVGRIRDEPPEIHCEYVVDGTRFRVDTAAVIEGYERRSKDVPAAWIDRVRVDVQRYEYRDTYYKDNDDGYASAAAAPGPAR